MAAGSTMIERVVSYATQQCWELPATILEGITLVLLVFVQDVAFKQSVIVCAALLFTSLGLHGLAYREGQCKVWPKIIELAAPVPFVAMIPPAYLATATVATQKSAFITINLWFAAVEVVLLATGRNFMMDYYQDWNPREVWGTPLLQRCAGATAPVWIIAQLLMAFAQGLAVALNLSIDTGNVAAAVFVCYIMQLLPLLFAVVFTFAYPAWLKRRWGCVKGDRATCYPPPAAGCDMLPPPPAAGSRNHLPEAEASKCAFGCPGSFGAKDASILCESARTGGSSGGRSSSSSCSPGCVSSAGSQDVLVCISPPTSSGGSKDCSSGDDDFDGVGLNATATVQHQQQQQPMALSPQQQLWPPQQQQLWPPQQQQLWPPQQQLQQQLLSPQHQQLLPPLHQQQQQQQHSTAQGRPDRHLGV